MSTPSPISAERRVNHRTHEPLTIHTVPTDHPKAEAVKNGHFYCAKCGLGEPFTYDSKCGKTILDVSGNPWTQGTEDDGCGSGKAVDHIDIFAPKPEIVLTIAGHARLGPSDAERWWNCPGSIRESRGIPRSTSVYAEEGTAAHKLAEECFASGKDAECYVGMKHGKDIEVTREMASAVQVYLDEVRRQVDETFGEPTYEGRADLSHIDPDLWGTYDSRVLVPFEVAHVNDYKNGVKVVEADALQLKLYALDALRFDVERVITTVIQPNAQHVDGPVRPHTYTADELRAFVPEVAKHAAATRDPDAPLAAGPWCHYCPAAPKCATLQARAIAVAQAEFGATPPKPADLTPAQVAEVLKHWGMVEAWGRAVIAHAYNVAQTGVAIPGYKLVAGKLGNRKWGDELKAADAIKAVGADPWKAEVVSPAAAEKLVGKKKFADVLAPLTTRAAGGVALVPEADKRPAIAAGPGADFDAVPQGEDF